jgi:hypothetical protein
MSDEVQRRPSQILPTKTQPKDPITLLGDPVRISRALEQMLKDHPKLTREEALAQLTAAGL